jgi:PAS domain S-box-containing protein
MPEPLSPPAGLDDVSVAAWRCDTAGEIDYVNLAWREFTGRGAAVEHGMGWVSGIHPEDLSGFLEIFGAAVDEQKPFEASFRMRLKDGRHHLVRMYAEARRDRDGAFEGFVGILEPDSPEARRARDRRETRRTAPRETLGGARGEIDHRMKNALFAIQALARQTLWGTPDLEKAYLRFASRLATLARSHDVEMIWGEGGRVPLDKLAREVGSAFVGEGESFEVAGDNVLIARDATLSLALCLHELFARSAEAGALARPGERVSLGWVRHGDGRVGLRWSDPGRSGPRDDEAFEKSGRLGSIAIRTIGRPAEPQTPAAPGRAQSVTCLIEFSDAPVDARPRSSLVGQV